MFTNIQGKSSLFTVAQIEVCKYVGAFLHTVQYCITIRGFHDIRFPGFNTPGPLHKIIIFTGQPNCAKG